MIPGNPLIWIAVIGILAGPCTYGVMKIQEWRQWQAAYSEGKQAGLGSTSTATVASVGQTAAAERAAEAATPLPADKQALIDLCKRTPECREHGNLK